MNTVDITCRSEYYANEMQARALSIAHHRQWMEPSLNTRLRVAVALPRSFMGRVLSSAWGWL